MAYTLKLGHAPTANDLTKRLIVEATNKFPGSRWWRRNVGSGYPAAVVNAALTALRRGDQQAAIDFLVQSRPILFGMPGEGDIDGFIPIDGKGVRANIEVKVGADRQREAQKLWEQMMVRGGCIYVIANTVEGALEDLQRKINALRH